jgi:hypothetical protein
MQVNWSGDATVEGQDGRVKEIFLATEKAFNNVAGS